VKQLLHRTRGVTGADGLFFMYGAIAQRVDVSRFGKHRFACRAAKTRLMQEGGDVVLIGQLQSGIGAERPFHRDLYRFAGKESCRRRRHGRLTLRLHRRVVHGWEFGGEEGEVGHRFPFRSGHVT